jgi:hypothetical protein
MAVIGLRDHNVRSSEPTAADAGKLSRSRRDFGRMTTTVDFGKLGLIGCDFAGSN